MARERYVVHLTPAQREELEGLIHRGKSSARTVNRARILLKAAVGWSGAQIAKALDLAPATVYGTKRRFVQEGMERALKERPRPGHPRKLDEKGEAHLIALACSTAPEGHEHWTLRLLAGKVVELGLTPSLSHEAVRQRLKKTPSSLGRRRSGASPR